jgi:two-component system, OmpR family, response regulator VicR
MRMKVLVVEDDNASLQLMQAALGSFDVQVHSFTSSRLAMAAIDSEKFDCLCLDLEMPEIHGFDLARRARESQHNRTTPIVIVTGREEKDTMKDSFGSGSTFFLQKPVDRQKLRNLFSIVWGTMIEAQRRVTRIPIRMKVSGRTTQHVFTAECVAISQQDMALDGAPLLPIGTNISLAFSLPDRKPEIDASGIVDSVDGNRTCIRFVQLNQGGTQRLRTLVDQAST